MISRLIIFLCLAIAASGATFRLYLKDGTFQMTNEYKVQSDRVSFYSTERGEWEDIPLEMIDLDRTKKEIADRETEVKAEAAAAAEEDKAENDAVKEIQLVPPDAGVYLIHGDKLDTMKVAESKLVANKRRNVLKILSPVPLITGKQTLELDGDSAALRLDGRPEFYFRLSNEESFALIRLSAKKGARVVENIELIPVSKEVVEHREEVPTFKKQASDMLYKIWPEQDLDPGEYALVEYTETKVNVQVWDFGVGKASAGDAPKKSK